MTIERPVDKVEIVPGGMESDDVAAFIKNDSGCDFEAIHESPKCDNPNTINAARKSRKDRNRRASVTLREDFRNVLEGLNFHKLESVNVSDRPGALFESLLFNKFGSLTNHRQITSNLKVSEIWRACARHFLRTDEDAEGFKGHRKIHHVFEEFRSTLLTAVNPQLCVCMFEDLVEVQWNMRWGAYCRQCYGKAENQDGWAVVVPQDRIDQGDFLSDCQLNTVDKVTPVSTAASGNRTRYSGFTNFQAEHRCRDHPSSAPIPLIDATRSGGMGRLADGAAMHHFGLANPNPESSIFLAGGTRKRRSSIQTLKRFLVGNQNKTSEADLIASRDFIPTEKLSSALYSSQDIHGPLPANKPTSPNFHAEWRTTDTAANFPCATYDEEDRYQYLDRDLLSHPGVKVNPLQPAVLCVLDGHGNGGKLGVARASTTISEALTVAMSNISMLAGQLGIETNALTKVLTGYTPTGVGVQDSNAGPVQELIYEKMGLGVNLKNKLCACQTDRQLLNHATSCLGNTRELDTMANIRNRENQNNLPSKTLDNDHKEPDIICFKKGMLEATRQFVLNLLSVTIRLAHSRILHENDCLNKDFGATCTAMVIAGRYLFTCWAGDSPGCLVAIKGNKFGVIRLTNEHSLHNITEQRRIMEFVGPKELNERDTKRRARRNSRGHIIETQTAGERLIPQHLPYAESRNKGLSINMSRALGHNQLTYCGLSPQPEFATVDILYALPRMRWCAGPKPGESSISSDNNRSFHNVNTHTNTTIGPHSLEECSGLLHLKPNPEWSSPLTDCENPFKALPSAEFSSAFRELELYAVCYSDGVGDCMNPCVVGAEIFDKRDLTCQDIANHLTAKAEQIRHVTNYLGKDNCVVAIAKMTLDAVIPVTNEE